MALIKTGGAIKSGFSLVGPNAGKGGKGQQGGKIGQGKGGNGGGPVSSVDPNFLFTTGDSTIHVGGTASQTMVLSGNFNLATTSTSMTGKQYFEMQTTAKPTNASVGLGVLLSTSTNGWNGPGWYGLNLGGTGCGASNGLYLNGSFSAGGGYAYALNDRIGFAYDATTRQLWIRKNGGAWLSGDPTAGTLPSATLAIGNYKPDVSFYSCNTTGGLVASVVLYVTNSQFTAAPPSGFTSYSGV